MIELTQISFQTRASSPATRQCVSLVMPVLGVGEVMIEGMVVVS